MKRTNGVLATILLCATALGQRNQQAAPEQVSFGDESFNLLNIRGRMDVTYNVINIYINCRAASDTDRECEQVVSRISAQIPGVPAPSWIIPPPAQDDSIWYGSEFANKYLAPSLYSPGRSQMNMPILASGTGLVPTTSLVDLSTSGPNAEGSAWQASATLDSIIDQHRIAGTYPYASGLIIPSSYYPNNLSIPTGTTGTSPTTSFIDFSDFGTSASGSLWQTPATFGSIIDQYKVAGTYTYSSGLATTSSYYPNGLSIPARAIVASPATGLIDFSPSGASADGSEWTTSTAHYGSVIDQYKAAGTYTYSSEIIIPTSYYYPNGLSIPTGANGTNPALGLIDPLASGTSVSSSFWQSSTPGRDHFIIDFEKTPNSPAQIAPIQIQGPSDSPTNDAPAGGGSAQQPRI